MRPLFLLLAVACATSSGAGSGSIAIKSVANASAPPTSYSVGNGVVSGSGLDIRLDQECIRGTLRKTPIQLCSEPGNPDHWTGATGDFTAVVSPDGRRVKVDGYLQPMGAQPPVDISQVIPLGEGPGWEEMRKHPALLVMASTAADLAAVRGRPWF